MKKIFHLVLKLRSWRDVTALECVQVGRNWKVCNVEEEMGFVEGGETRTGLGLVRTANHQDQDLDRNCNKNWEKHWCIGMIGNCDKNPTQTELRCTRGTIPVGNLVGRVFGEFFSQFFFGRLFGGIWTE